MTVGPGLLAVMMWGGIAAVAVGAIYLLVVLVADYRGKRLW
ncbi:MAG: hypothetical protein R3B72_27465 [Polyangiaceae bacterium]